MTPWIWGQCRVRTGPRLLCPGISQAQVGVHFFVRLEPLSLGLQGVAGSFAPGVPHVKGVGDPGIVGALGPVPPLGNLTFVIPSPPWPLQQSWKEGVAFNQEPMTLLLACHCRCLSQTPGRIEAVESRGPAPLGNQRLPCQHPCNEDPDSTLASPAPGLHQRELDQRATRSSSPWRPQPYSGPWCSILLLMLLVGTPPSRCSELVLHVHALPS